jgi:pimeloyl-ACP methyl ester carboxylesterase
VGAIRVHEFVTLDGVIGTPTFTFDYGFDLAMGGAIADAMGGSDGILLGRTTYQMFEPAWSTWTAADDPGAPFMNDTTKWLTKRGDQACRRCLQPLLTSPAIRRDTTAVLRAIAADPGVLTRVAEQLPGFTRPALIAWAAHDRVMPPEHGRRLAKLLPDARHVEIPDSYTLIPLDQPAPLARELRAFIRDTPPPAEGTSGPGNSR